MYSIQNCYYNNIAKIKVAAAATISAFTCEAEDTGLFVGTGLGIDVGELVVTGAANNTLVDVDVSTSVNVPMLACTIVSNVPEAD